jgi:hypothetical protein
MADRQARQQIQALEKRVRTLEERLGMQPAPPVPSPRAFPSSPPRPAGFDSKSIKGFQELLAEFFALFTEFREKRFALLWRGSRDGFGARDFHCRCGGHTPTLTPTQDRRKIFEGFTGVARDSSNARQADPNQKSFVFTLMNPLGQFCHL